MTTQQDTESFRHRQVPPLDLNTGLGRFRLAFGYLIGAACLFLVERPLLLPGVLIALLGIGIRVWAAGCIVKKRRLTTTGPYSLTRNPLYLGSFLLGAGSIMAVRIWWPLLVYIPGFALFYVPTIAKEERYLHELYGEEYNEYRRRVPTFIPWKPLFTKGGFSFTELRRNREHIHAIVYILFLGLLEMIGFIRA